MTIKIDAEDTDLKTIEYMKRVLTNQPCAIKDKVDQAIYFLNSIKKEIEITKAWSDHEN